MFHRTIYLMLLSCLLSTTLQAQNEGNNWILGRHAGANFGPMQYSNIPTIDTLEGCASISDANGQLLFYAGTTQNANTVTIWGRNHQPLPHGTGLFGDYSSTQTVLIVPWPQTGCRKFIVFTVQAAFTPGLNSLGLYYSVVDMAVPPFGDVVVKNVLLKTDVAEKLAAVMDSLGNFRVVAHGFSFGNTMTNTEYYSWYIDPNGLTSLNPVVSYGAPHVSGSTHPNHWWGAIGQMRVSPDGQWIAAAVFSKMVEVLRFSTTTGMVSGTPIIFNADPVAPHAPFNSSTVYGVEFSPDSSLVYTTTANGTSELYQLRPVPHTGTLIFTGSASTTGYDMGSLQLSPDHTAIYVARNGNPKLDAIRSPNSLGTAANYAPNWKPLLSGSSGLGLPNMVAGPFTCANRNGCPLGTTPTVINGITFCCTTNPETGQECCKRLCDLGASETTYQGTTLCCTAESGGAIGNDTSKVCCKKP